MKMFLFSLYIVIAVTNAHAQTENLCEGDLYKKIQFVKKEITVCHKKINVDIADNESLRSIGLMCREKMDDKTGMLFVFEKPLKASFWMKNTKIPLSIAFFSDKKKLINIDEMQAMDETSIHVSKRDALYALEMNAQWFDRNKIKPGCTLQIP